MEGPLLIWPLQIRVARRRAASLALFLYLQIADGLRVINSLAYARRAGVCRCVFWSGVASDDASRHVALKDWWKFPEPAGQRKARTNRILRRELRRSVSHESPLGNPL